MTPAKKSKWGTRLIHSYTHHLFKKHFFSITIGGSGINFLRNHFSSAIFFGNHHYWWDGLLEVALMRGFQLDSYTMMEEKNLLQFPFFRRAGVFGVNLESKHSRVAALRYSKYLLQNVSSYERRALFLYPQGRISPPFAEDFPYQRGMESLLRWSPYLCAIPMHKEIVFWKFPHPIAHIEIGEPIFYSSTFKDTDLSSAVLKQKKITQERFAKSKWDDTFAYFFNRKDLQRTTDLQDFPIKEITPFQNEFTNFPKN